MVPVRVERPAERRAVAFLSPGQIREREAAAREAKAALKAKARRHEGRRAALQRYRESHPATVDAQREYRARRSEKRTVAMAKMDAAGKSREAIAKAFKCSTRSVTFRLRIAREGHSEGEVNRYMRKRARRNPVNIAAFSRRDTFAPWL